MQNIPGEQEDRWYLMQWRHYTGKWYVAFGMLLLLRFKLITQGHEGWGNAVLLVLLVLLVWLSMQRSRFRRE